MDLELHATAYVKIMRPYRGAASGIYPIRQTYLSFLEVDDSLWVGVDISGNRQGENAGRLTLTPFI